MYAHATPIEFDSGPVPGGGLMTLVAVPDIQAPSITELAQACPLAGVELVAAAYASSLPTDCRLGTSFPFGNWQEQLPECERALRVIYQTVEELGLETVIELGAELRREDRVEYAIYFQGRPRRRHHHRWKDARRLEWARLAAGNPFAVIEQSR